MWRLLQINVNMGYKPSSKWNVQSNQNHWGGSEWTIKIDKNWKIPIAEVHTHSTDPEQMKRNH